MRKVFLFICLFFLMLQVNAKELYKGSEVFMDNIKEVRASHLLVDTKDQAENIKQEINAGKDFGQAASEVSKCPSGSRGGDLGYFGRGMMVPEFEQAAFSMPVGQVSEPIKTQFGWHLIKVTDKR